MRVIIGIFTVIIAVAFDARVPEASGELRWLLAHILGGAAGVWMGIRLLRRHRAPGIVYAVIFYAVMGIKSLIWTISIADSQIMLAHVLSYLAIFFAVYMLRDREWYRRLMWAMAIGMAVNSLIGLGQYYHVDIWIVTYFKQTAPPAGTLCNKNLLASYLAGMIPIAVYLSRSSRKMVWRMAAGGIAALGVIMLVKTGCRASALALGVVIVLAACWMFYRRRQWVAAGAVGICALMTGGWMLKGIMAEDSFKVRWAYGLNSLAIVRDYPGGVGIGAWRVAYPVYAGAMTATPVAGFNQARRPRRAHNDIAQAFAELGILGGAALMVIYGLLIRMGIKSGDDMSLWMLAGVMGLEINSALDFPMQLPLAAIMFWMLAGMMTGIYKGKFEARSTKSETN